MERSDGFNGDDVEEFNEAWRHGKIITGVACNSGGRASRACVDLLNAGYEHVTNMEGGYSAWVDAGFAGDKPAAELKTACKFRL
ncbi:hypothetical protein N665_0864s0014 [Sinapis alba]|nr:hypothetical protein N665_0864s0014 [Sinapis alba]